MGASNTKKPMPNRYRSNMNQINLSQNLSDQYERPSSNLNYKNAYNQDSMATTNVEADFNIQYDKNRYTNKPMQFYETNGQTRPDLNAYEVTDNDRNQNFNQNSQRILEPNMYTNARPLIPDVNYVPTLQPTQPLFMPQNNTLSRKATTSNEENKTRYLKTINKNTINPAVINPSQNTLKKLYDIQPYEMRKLQKLFFQFAGNDRKMNFQEFVKLYGNINPSLRGPDIINIAEQAFMASDTNDDGLLNFDEFLIAYCLTKPDRSFIGFPDLYKPSLNHFNENQQTFNTLQRRNMLPYYPSQTETQEQQPLPVEYQQTVESNQIPSEAALPPIYAAAPPPPPPVQLQHMSVQTVPVQQKISNNNFPIENYPPPIQQSVRNQPSPIEDLDHEQYDYDRRHAHMNMHKASEYNQHPSFDNQYTSPDYNQNPPSEYNPYPQFDLNLLPTPPSLPRRHKSMQKKSHFNSLNKMPQNYFHRHNDSHPPLFDPSEKFSQYRPAPPPRRQSNRRRSRC